MEKLLVSVLGDRDSGKSTVWNALFKKTVKTGTKLRRLYLSDLEYVNVFLISGSAEERGKYIGKIITIKEPAIVLCSVQYIDEGKQTFDYFIEREYNIYCHWLNPGFNDENNETKPDIIDIINYLTKVNALVKTTNAKIDLSIRVTEIKDFIYKWANLRGLVLKNDTK